MPSAAPTALEDLAAEAAGCRACPLWRDATQTVFGEGPPGAELMLVGEQPGDQEDRAGRPFVGPAGRLLDDALAEAGIDRGSVYLTNAVKHFKWKPAGSAASTTSRRGARSARAARGSTASSPPWSLACSLVGATAAQGLLGRSFRVTQSRGVALEDTGLARHVLATVHPSSILRERDGDARHAARNAFVDDLRAAAGLL